MKLWFGALTAGSCVVAVGILANMWRKGMLKSPFKTFLLEPWKEINAEAMEARYRGLAEDAALGKGKRGRGDLASSAPREIDFRVVVVFVLAAVSLALQDYYGDRSDFARFLLRPPDGHPHLEYDAQYDLYAFSWWSGARFVGYFLLPVIAIFFMRGERVRDYGLSTKGFREHLPIYVTLFLLILPAVVIASATKTFQHTYPFYDGARLAWKNLILWELLYALQFFSLEFFFRGFLLHGTKRSLGAYSIFAMIVPYCMIHFGKPLGETLGAVGAGVVLGTLALRTRSIWAGVLIHISVAVVMDILALAHTVGLPHR